MVEKKKKDENMLIGMKAICAALQNISESTVLKWHRESDLPMKKSGGIWVASRKRIEKWWDEFTEK